MPIVPCLAPPHAQSDSCRKFYTSLRQQKPHSELAKRW